MTDLLYLLIALGLVALNAFFVATEFAIVKVRSTRIEELASRGMARAATVRDVIEDLNPYLAACQLGITLASLGLGWVGEPAFAHLIEPLFVGLGAAQGVATHTLAVTLSFVVITLLHVVLGELVPKTIAIDYTLKTALVVAWPIRIFSASMNGSPMSATSLAMSSGMFVTPLASPCSRSPWFTTSPPTRAGSPRCIMWHHACEQMVEPLNVG